MIILRMLSDKDSRVKEGMKIMGLKEINYFWSYLLHYIITNTINAVISSLVLLVVLSEVNYFNVFLIYWLFGMCIFSMAFFFQSFIDKTRIGIII